MNIDISGIDVQINKKNIKNMHLSVKPPLGKVVVSAPFANDGGGRGENHGFRSVTLQ